MSPFDCVRCMLPGYVTRSREDEPMKETQESPLQVTDCSPMTEPKCCCQWGAAVGSRGLGPSGEYPEFGCAKCPVHNASMGETEMCRRHRKENPDLIRRRPVTDVPDMYRPSPHLRCMVRA